MRLLSPSLLRCGVALAAMAAAGARAQSQPVSGDAAASRRLESQIDAALREKESRTPAMRKMSQDLVYSVRMAYGQNVRDGLPGLILPNIVRKDGTVDVEFVATVTPTLLSQLQVLGARIGEVYPSARSISASIPIRALESAALLPGVGYVHTPSLRVSNAGSVQTEGDKSLRADELRTTYGLSGTGVKIGVVSDSDLYREQSQASGDLPSAVQVLAGRDGRPGLGEGTAMMETAYDLAPGASFAFSTGGASQAALAQNLRDLFAAGCGVLVDDVSFIDEPAFQDGLVASAINEIFTAGGLCISAGGNAGNKASNTTGTWEGNFLNSGKTMVGKGGVTRPLHAWSGTSTTDNKVVTIGKAVGTLQWNDPWHSAPGADVADYDLFVYDPRTSSIVATSMNVNGGDVPPLETCPADKTALAFYVVKYSGGDRVLRLVQHGGTLVYTTTGAIYGHAAAEKGIGVAAFAAAKNPQRPYQSSDAATKQSPDGLRRIYYDANGVQLTQGLTAFFAINRQQPLIGGPDGTLTTVSGFNPFGGTSAAAAHVAGLAALVKEFAPDATSDELRTAIYQGAVNGGFPGNTLGYGGASGKGAVRKLFEAKQPTISPNNATIAGNGNLTLTLDFGRKVPPKGLTINLTTPYNVGQWTVPATMTVPGGSQTGQVVIRGEGTGTNMVEVKFTEAYSGAVLGSVVVKHTGGPVSIRELVLDRSEVVGSGRNAVATVVLDGETPSVFWFDIQTSDTTATNVPQFSGVSSGQASRNFVVGTYSVPTDRNVTIRVRKQGSTGPWTEAVLKVKAPHPISCVPNPTSGMAGTQVTYTLKLDGFAPAGGLKVGLTTTDASIIAVPRNITFNEGDIQKSFTATVGPSQVKKVVTVSVRYELQTWAQGKFTYLVPEVGSLALSPNPVKGGKPVTGTVTLASAAGPGGVLVTLGHYGTGLSHPATVLVPEGATSATFAITTNAVAKSQTNKVYAKTGSVSKTVVLTINP